MIGAKELHPAGAASYYWSFHSNYFEPETRRLDAQTLIPGTPAREQGWQYPTRAILAAQWNDTCEQGLETARVLYSLEPTLTHYLGQSVLKLTGATVSEVKDLRNDGDLPPYGFSIDVGTIDEDTRPEYGFRRTPKQFLPEGSNPNGAFLDFQISLPVAAIGSIDVDSGGKVELHQSFKERADFVAYSGRVSLERDRELYARTRQTSVGNLAFGNGRSFGIVYELLKSTGGTHFEEFQEMFAAGELSPSQPLTNLTSIAN